jgi:RNA-directed DNA polymerase
VVSRRVPTFLLMGFRDWLRRLLGRTRDVTRLGGADVDKVEELVDLSGGPLKPGHLRRALRDARLLPKAKRPRLPFTKRKKHFARDEAARLFASTLRTSNRQIRDLLPDTAQLARYGLPAWKTEQDVADALGLTVRQLRGYSIHRERERRPHYVAFAIPKRRGGERLILAPKKKLKAIQRDLLRLLIDKLPVSDVAHGFRAGRSIRTGAEPHVGQEVLLQVDLADFFPSVTFQRVRGLFLAFGYGYPVAATLAALCTESERQPVDVDGTVFHVPVGPRHCVQGAPTSPGICNAVTMKLDHRLQGLARAFDFRYTRYADDLTFSGPDDPRLGALLHRVREIVEDEGFRLNPAKTRFSRAGRRQVVTGVSVNDVLGLPRRERRRLRAALHRAALSDVGAAERARLGGMLAYVEMLNPGQAEALRRGAKRQR